MRVFTSRSVKSSLLRTISSSERNAVGASSERTMT
jgi:hypothetical protein